MPEFRIFGRTREDIEDAGLDAQWWPLWASEEHEADDRDAMLAEINERLLTNGEDNYVHLVAVPVDEWDPVSFTEKRAGA